MSLSEQTLWVKCEDGYHAVITDDNGPPVEEILGIENIESYRAKDFAPCRDCEHLTACMESRWNETRMGQDETRSISTVHTCASCDEKVMTILADGMMKRVVPDDCPRWDALHGCAHDCGGCMSQRREIEKAHPRYKQKQDNMKEVAQAFEDALRAKDEFTRKRHNKKMNGLALEGMFPGCEMADYEDENVFYLSQEIWMEMLKAIKTGLPDFWAEVNQNAFLLALMTQGGLDYLYHSLGRNLGDVEKVVEELVLFLTDDGLFSRHWARFRVSEKKLIKRGWQGVFRRVWSSYEAQV